MHTLNRLRNYQVLLILFFLGILAYFQVFLNGFVGDDKEQIYNFALVNSIWTLPKIFFYHHVVLGSEHSLLSGYYKPLMLLYFYSIRMIIGFNPFYYHAIQIIIGIINSFLAFLFFTKFFKKYLAFFLSSIFLVHPINQELIAYVSNIQDALFFIFGMSAFLISMKKDLKTKDYIFISILLLLSLLSKENGILFVFIIPIYKLLLKDKNLSRMLIVIFSAFIPYLILRFSSQTTNVFWIEPPPLATISLAERLKHIPVIFFYYVKTFFYPNVLSFNQQWTIRNISANTFYYPLMFDVLFISGLLLLIYLFIKRHIHQSITLIFFVIWFFTGIIPHLQILPLDATVATRWFYFSSVGILGMAGIMVSFFEKKISSYKYFIIIILILCCVLLSIRTIYRNFEWKDAFTLYSTDANISQSPLLENNLGDEYFRSGDVKNAKIHFQRALDLNPHLWIAINNFGIIEEQNKNYTKAYYYYHKALAENDRLPINENIGRVLVLSNKPEEARKFINNALKEYPLSAKLWLTLSLANYDLKNYREALQDAEKSNILLPDPKTENVINIISNILNQKSN